MRAAYITFSAARCCVWIWASRAWRHWRRWNLWEDALLWCTWNCDFLAASNLVETFGRMRCAEIFESEWRNVFFLNKFFWSRWYTVGELFLHSFWNLDNPQKNQLLKLVISRWGFFLPSLKLAVRYREGFCRHYRQRGGSDRYPAIQVPSQHGRAWHSLAGGRLSWWCRAQWGKHKVAMDS